jgi:hypothetical protein
MCSLADVGLLNGGVLVNYWYVPLQDDNSVPNTL